MQLSTPSSARVARWLTVLVLVLTLLSVAGQVSKYFLGHPSLKGFVPAFHLDNESNVPTWYSSFALGLVGGLLTVAAWAKISRREPYRFHWAALAAIFVFLSVDEVAMLHEYPIDPLREALYAGGLLYYTWVIPGMVLVAAVGVSFLGFLRHLPPRTRRGFCMAGAVFVAGAIGVEMLSGLHADRAGEENFVYAMIITVEEFFEMMGVVVFIYALLDYLAAELGGIRVCFGRTSTEAA